MEYGVAKINQIGATANADDAALRFNGLIWDTVGVGVNDEICQKQIVITRIADAATESVNYTGWDFKPKAIMAVGGAVYPSAGTNLYVGVCSSTSAARSGSWATNDVQGADSWDGGSGGFVRFLYGGGSNQIGTLGAFLDDGITIDWTKAGTPPASVTIQVHILAFR